MKRIGWRMFATATQTSRQGRTVTRLEDTVSRLTTPHSTIYLVGTCHVSKASADEVTSLVRQHTPETVLVELCRARADRLMEGVTEEEEAKRFMSALVKGSGVGTAMSSSLSMMGKAASMIGNPASLLGSSAAANLGSGADAFRQAMSKLPLPPAMAGLQNRLPEIAQLSAVSERLQHAVRYFQDQQGQQDRPPWFQAFLKSLYQLLRTFGLTSGAEFKAAIVEARAVNGRVVLGDREGEETVSRISKAITFKEFMAGAQRRRDSELSKKFSQHFSKGGTLESLLEMMKTRETAREMTDEMKEGLPQLYKVLVEERDDILYHNLLRCPGSTVVAVVGMAHMDGIESRFLADAPGEGGSADFY